MFGDDDDWSEFAVDGGDQAESQRRVGLENENEGGYGLRGLPRRPLTVEGAHQNAEIEPGDMDQVALVEFSRPRSQARRLPRRSRIWAKERSTRSPRRRMVSRPISDLSRTRLA